MIFTVRTERLVAFERLLALPDDRGMRRGHRLTYPGRHDRLQTIWLRSARAWCQHRISQALGEANGWKPAETTRRSSRVLSIGRGA